MPEADPHRPHRHDGDGGHHHHDHPGAAAAVRAVPVRSLFLVSALDRLAGAAVLVFVLWLAVGWAIGWW